MNRDPKWSRREFFKILRLLKPGEGGFEHENVVKGGPGWPLREIVCKYSGFSSRENESLNMKML